MQRIIAESQMENQKINLHFGVLATLIVLAAFSRVIPHMANFSPLGAIGLFGAAHFTKRWQAFLVPIAATWLSDLFINNVIYAQYYPSFTWFYQGFYWQYGSYLLITLAGIFIFKKVNTKSVFTGALASSTIFFLVSNFGVWASGTMYPMNLGGLTTCFAAGIPFLKGTMLGDLFYSCVLFGTFALAQKQFPILQLKNA
ncbi:MAG: hypothetical protein LC107_11570 [Chitinophagales bacterium]|nr:hypothetical protein [Chitinophagales bacterium]